MRNLQQEQIKEVIEEINNGAVVAVPTETVYGLAVKFDNKIAIDKLIAIKERDSDSGKFFTLLLSSTDDIQKYATPGESATEIVNKHFPGELTVVLRKNPEFVNVYFDDCQTIGIRIPDHEFMLELLRGTGPLLVTSANRKGQTPATNSNSVEQDLPEVDVIVVGDAGNHPPSTVVDLTTDVPKVLRQGRELANSYKESRIMN